MYDFSLFYICVMAFTAVFLLLTILAAVMRLMLVVFPYREGEVVTRQGTGAVDQTVIAAITGVTAAVYPGAKITNIEEIK